MKKVIRFSDRVQEELNKKRLAETTDETTEKTDGVKQETVAKPTVKTPEEMAQNPNDAIKPDEMNADKYNLQGDPKATWDAVTAGAAHPITKCMESMKGKVDDPGAFCNWLAEKVGYTPER